MTNSIPPIMPTCLLVRSRFGCSAKNPHVVKANDPRPVGHAEPDIVNEQTATAGQMLGVTVYWILSPASVCATLWGHIGRILMTRPLSTAWQSLDFIIEKGGLLLSLVLLIGLTLGCSDSNKISTAVFATHSSGEPVVEATKNALKMIGYLVGEKIDTKEAAKGSLAIDGERMGGMITAIGPRKVRIHIVVSSLEKGSEIQVEIVPPTGGYGSTTLILHDYQYALTQLLPDLNVKSRKVPKEWL